MADLERCCRACLPSPDTSVHHEFQLLDDAIGDRVVHICNGVHDASSSNTLASSTDQTGCHVWAAALVLARWLATDPKLRALIAGSVVVELGAGCGVPGLMAALHTHARRVVLTDLNADTLSNLRVNADSNLAACAAWCSLEVLELDWNTVEAAAAIDEPADVLLGSDLCYESDAVRLVGAVVRALLPPGGHFLYVDNSDRFALAPELLRGGAFVLESQAQSPAALEQASGGGEACDKSRAPLAMVHCRCHAEATRPGAPAETIEAETCGPPFAELRTRTFTMHHFRRR